jgi:hypothetical protein
MSDIKKGRKRLQELENDRFWKGKKRDQTLFFLSINSNKMGTC